MMWLVRDTLLEYSSHSWKISSNGFVATTFPFYSPYSLVFNLQNHPDSDIRHSAYCILSSMFPICNTFGSTAIFNIPLSDTPYKFFDGVLSADLYPSHALPAAIKAAQVNEEESESSSDESSSSSSSESSSSSSSSSAVSHRRHPRFSPSSLLPFEQFPVPRKFEVKRPIPLSFNSFFYKWKEIDKQVSNQIVIPDDDPKFSAKRTLYSNVLLFFLIPSSVLFSTLLGYSTENLCRGIWSYRDHSPWCPSNRAEHKQHAPTSYSLDCNWIRGH